MSSGEENGAYLGAMSYNCLYATSIDRLKKAHHENAEAVDALNNLQSTLLQADKASPSFLYDLSRILLADSKLSINVQESYLRMQSNATNEDLEVPHFRHITEFQDLFFRAIALRRVLSRIPDEMTDRRPFLETIKEIASSIKKLLDATNLIISKLPENTQPPIEKRKREFVHYSKRFSNTLKEYFKLQNSDQVFVAANLLIFQTAQIIRAIREKVRVQ